MIVDLISLDAVECVISGDFNILSLYDHIEQVRQRFLHAVVTFFFIVLCLTRGRSPRSPQQGMKTTR